MKSFSDNYMTYFIFINNKMEFYTEQKTWSKTLSIACVFKEENYPFAANNDEILAVPVGINKPPSIEKIKKQINLLLDK
jgi:hypothetical protein